MSDDPPGWPPRFDDEAYRLIGAIIAAWSDIHEFVHNGINGAQTLIYVQQARAWRAAHGGQSHFGRVKRPDDIPASRFGLRWRYYRRVMNALNHQDKKVASELDKIGNELTRLYQIRNDLAHSQISISMRWHPNAITLRCRTWMDNWQLKSRQESGRYERPPPTFVTMTKDELVKALSDMRDTLQRLNDLPEPFDESNPPTQPDPPR